MLHDTFDVGIVDNHLSFASPLTGRLHFGKKYSAYFSELVVKRVSHNYVVVESLEPNVKVGAYITDKSTLYPTLPTNKEEYFLVGCRSWNDINSISVSINNINTQISVHRSKAVNKTESKDVCLNEYSLNNIPVIRSNCCDYIDPLIKDIDVSYIGKKYADSEKLIWNNLSNEGGYSIIPKQFIYGLNNYVACEEYCAKLISPLTEGKDCRREWVLYDSSTYEREKGLFRGTLFFLMNSDTASSGETSVLYAKSLNKVVFIGENSMGCNTFGNVANYQLSNSNIILRVPNMINLCKEPDNCEEGKGFTPEFWVDSSDVEGEVLRWLSEGDEYLPHCKK
jgi:hypothetical protein